MIDKLTQKLEILSDAAKYDTSCASGTAGKRKAGKDDKTSIGSLTGGTGICHSFTPDGRCVSLLKILMYSKPNEKTEISSRNSCRSVCLLVTW